MNNKMKKDGYITTWRMLFLAVVCLIPLAHTAYAEPGRLHGQQMERMADELQLTDEQRQQLKNIHRGKRSEAMLLHDAMQDNREALEKLNPGASNYEAQLVKLAGEKAQLVKRKVIQEGKMRARVYAILTPEQREKATEMKRHHRPCKGGGERGDRGHEFRPR